MDYSAANAALWEPVIQFGVIAALILVANLLRRKIPFIRRSLMPTAVLAGFIMLILRTTGILKMNTQFLESLTYHAICIGFIALTLRIPEKSAASGGLIGSKSGALIVSTYLVQATIGLIISLLLAYTIMPGFFKASGILLPMGFGQGPGQANNVGTTYEALGLVGGRSFGLSIAAAGYLCACIVGVVFLNIYDKKGIVKRYDVKEELAGSVTIDTFQDHNEIPISESIDRLSIQVALIAVVYLITYLATWGLTELLALISPGLAATVSTLLWGFNFIIGSLVAMIVRSIFTKSKKLKWMTRQYQNNYLLSRVSGLAFDFMIVAGVASIDISDLSVNWLPFVLMVVLGGIGTFVYLKYMCKKIYPDYPYEGFFSMYGMLTGTISSGVLLLREIDPELKTPAANNLVTGSSFGIAFGAPVLLLVSLAAKGDVMTFVTLGIIFVYFALLIAYIALVGKKKKK